MLEDIPAYKFTRLWRVGYVGIASLALVYGLCVITIELGIMYRNPDPSAEKGYEEFDNPFPDIVRGTIPYVQTWYRDMDYGDDLLPSVLDRQQQDSALPQDTEACVQSWMDDLRTYVNETQPHMIETILESMDLRESFFIRNALQDYLEAPQPILELYAETEGCLNRVVGYGDLACSLRENTPWDLEQRDQLVYLIYSVNLGVVLQVLTDALQSDVMALTEITEKMLYERFQAKEEFIHRQYSDKNYVAFHMDKYKGIASFMKTYALMTSTNELFSSDETLAVNILEAVKLDAILGHHSNAKLGAALAALSKPGSAVEDFTYTRKLGKRYVDAYLTWNFAFIAGNLPLYAIPSVLLPATTCTSTEENQAELWIGNRVISLALTLMLIPKAPSSDLQDKFVSNDIELLVNKIGQETDLSLDEDHFDAMDELGVINLHTNRLSSPSQSTMEEMFYKLCGGFCYDGLWGVTDTAPHDDMNDTQNQIYIGFVIWASTLMAGLGLEFFIWLKYLQKWCENREYWWRAAQFVFPIMTISGLGLAFQQNYLGLLILVACVWKFGYPETVMYFYLGLYHKQSSFLEKVSDFLNGVGTLTHHSTVAFVASMALTGAFPVKRRVLNIVMILIMQHWFVLVKYFNDPIYVAIQIFLEVWLEWLIFSNFWYLYDSGWVVAFSGATILVAHWLYLLAGGLSLAATASSEGDENVHTRGTQAFRRQSAMPGTPGNATEASLALSTTHSRRRSTFDHSDVAVLEMLKEEDEFEKAHGNDLEESKALEPAMIQEGSGEDEEETSSD